ncbi:MAG: hypothetical protein RSA66_09980 [Muribaculaceae bacterium]
MKDTTSIIKGLVAIIALGSIFMQTASAQIKFGEDPNKEYYAPVKLAAAAFPVKCEKILLTTIKRYLDIKKFRAASKSYVPYNGLSMNSIMESIANDGSFKPLDKLFDMLVEMDFPSQAEPFKDNLFAAIEAQQEYLVNQKPNTDALYYASKSITNNADSVLYYMSQRWVEDFALAMDEFCAQQAAQYKGQLSKDINRRIQTYICGDYLNWCEQYMRRIVDNDGKPVDYWALPRSEYRKILSQRQENERRAAEPSKITIQ